MSQQPRAPVVGVRHAPEMVAVDVRHAVVAGEPLVDERVVGAQHVEHAAVAAELVLEEQLRLAAERGAQVVVEVGKQRRVGGRRAQVAQIQPLAPEILDERLRARIVEHPRHLPVDLVRVVQPPLRGQRNQLLVGRAAPEEERQPRGQVDVPDAVRRTGHGIRGVVLDAEQELGRYQQGLERPADPFLEAAALPVAVVVGSEQRLNVAVRHRPPVRLPRERPQDLLGAPRLLLRSLRVAAQDAPAGRRLRRDVALERPDHLDRRHHRHVGVEAVRVAGDGWPRRSAVDRERLGQVAGERGAQQPRARLDRDAHLERSAVAAADLERLDPLPVQPDLKHVRPAPARPEPRAQDVLRVEREVVPRRVPAARPERQVVAYPAVLQHQRRGLVQRGGRRQRRVAERPAADLRRGQNVALQQHGRYRQDVADVVEAVARLVSRQQRPPVHLQRQQVADGVGVLRPVQPLDRRPAGVRTRVPGVVEGALEVVGQRVVRGGVGPRAPGGRHGAGAQLLRHLLPHVGAAADVADIDGVERQAAGQQTLVVAADAVALQKRLVGFGSRFRRRLSGRRRTAAEQAGSKHQWDGCRAHRVANSGAGRFAPDRRRPRRSRARRRGSPGGRRLPVRPPADRRRARAAGRQFSGARRTCCSR